MSQVKSTKTEGPEIHWVPKVEESNYDVDMFDSSKWKCRIDSVCSNHMTKEINMFYYFTPTRRKSYLYSHNKGKIVGFGTIGKIFWSFIRIFRIIF